MIPKVIVTDKRAQRVEDKGRGEETRLETADAGVGRGGLLDIYLLVTTLLDLIVAWSKSYN